VRAYLAAMRFARALLCLLGLTAACQRSEGGACGFTAIAGATMLLQEFGVPNQTLGEPPEQLPPRLVTRIAAGPAYEGMVGRTEDGRWLVGVEGNLPATIRPQYGVLILDLSGTARGVMLYESKRMRGAPSIGQVNVDSLMLPLLGIQLDPARFEDPRCPLFPDSVIP